NTANLNLGANTIIISVATSCGDASKSITVNRKEPVVESPEMITICFNDPNDRENRGVTMTIPLSDWPQYQSQGAVLGPCVDSNQNEEEESNEDQLGTGNPRDLITICYTNPSTGE